MNKKGFTLIELLAIIVILAVIALITTPVITDTIANVRKNGDKQSAIEYIKAIETKLSEAALEYPNIIIGDSINATTDAATRKWPCTQCSATNEVDIDFKGTAPQKASLEYKDGKILGKLKYVNYCGKTDDNGNIIEIPKDTSDSADKTFCGF